MMASITGGIDVNALTTSEKVEKEIVFSKVEDGRFRAVLNVEKAQREELYRMLNEKMNAI